MLQALKDAGCFKAQAYIFCKCDIKLKFNCILPENKQFQNFQSLERHAKDR